MNNQIKFDRAFYFLFALIPIFTACNKDNSLSDSEPDTLLSDYIAVAAQVATSSATSADSIYLVQPCGKGGSRDSINETSLPTSAQDYLQANYTGYTFARAFAINNSSHAVTGYVAVIFYNEKPVGIQFDSNGNFVKILEQREKGDLKGKGWHHGGRFGDRGNPQKDSIALSTLPTSVITYMSSNFGSDTLLKAYTNRDSTLVLLSNNSGIFATVFNGAGAFVKRVQLPAKTAGRCVSVDVSNLPAGVSTYLASTYPNYVFKKAFAVSSGSVQRYIVFIDANNTRYALQFSASGNFEAVKTVW